MLHSPQINQQQMKGLSLKTGVFLDHSYFYYFFFNMLTQAVEHVLVKEEKPNPLGYMWVVLSEVQIYALQ